MTAKKKPVEKPLTFHEVTKIFPLMSDEEFSALKEDIRARGQLDPIWTYQGKIIDGRNRYRACRELGIQPTTEEWNGEGSLIGFVTSKNLHRRHLSSSLRAAIAVDILPKLEEEARGRQTATRKKGDSPVRQIFAGRETGRAPEVLKAVRDGAISIPDGRKLADMPINKRAEAITLIRKGEAKTVAAAGEQFREFIVEECRKRDVSHEARMASVSWFIDKVFNDIERDLQMER